MNDPGASNFEELMQSASSQVTDEDVEAAKESSEKMKQHADSLDMLQNRMFAVDSGK